MKPILFDFEPPSFWDKLCIEHNATFHTANWHRLLHKAFNCQTIYCWDKDQTNGFTISVFKAGLFYIGYLSFPVGGTITGQQIDNIALTNTLKNITVEFSIHCLRIPVSAFNNYFQPDNSSVNFTPETAITELQNWNIESVSKKLRRDIKKSQHPDLDVSEADNLNDANYIYNIYNNTIRRHHGSLRYNKTYFNEIVRLSIESPSIHCFTAKVNNEIAAFVITILHNRTTYYLHGGTNQSLKQYNASDLLLYNAIEQAKHKNSNCFNLMASPAAQHSLIRYKEKWGAITRQHQTVNIPIQPVYCKLFEITSSLYNKMDTIKSRFLPR